VGREVYRGYTYVGWVLGGKKNLGWGDKNRFLFLLSLFLLAMITSVAKRRIDSLLVEKGLVESRAKAQALIMAGEVRVEGKAAIKPGTLVAEEAEITILQPPPFVSRGGIKLDYALSQFRLDVSSKVAADIGASTGGFTDCLLQRGASRVYALDVGYGQLDYRLRQDKRVVVMERVNARYPVSLPEKVDLATIDISFISVEKVLPSVAKLLKDDGYLLVLLKPQFEARRKEVGKGGIIKDPLVHARVIGRFIAWAVGQGFRIGGLIASPILGAEGNMEFFVLLRLT
jgi:23S rRNA (cytidine1920-2'-O)/16S rRNA (cytidine1409-2'-O)-methyltransferase